VAQLNSTSTTFGSAVDLRKSSTTRRSNISTQPNSTSSDNVRAVAFKSYAPKFRGCQSISKHTREPNFRGRFVDHSVARQMQARCTSRHTVNGTTFNIQGGCITRTRRTIISIIQYNAYHTYQTYNN